MNTTDITETGPTEWTGPARFLSPPDPSVRADGTHHFSGITYAAPIGYRPLQLDVWVPATAAPAPLVGWIHGGAWMGGDRRQLPETLRPNQLFDELLGAGLAVATVDYRLAKEAPFPEVTVTVDGPGALQGLGSAAAATTESYTDAVHTTLNGRALAVIRPTGAGEITVTVSAEGCDSVRLRAVAR